MPWKVKPNNGKFNVVKKGDGAKVATHATREAALKQVKAMYASHPSKGQKTDKSYASAAQRRMATKKKALRKKRHPHQYYGEGE